MSAEDLICAIKVVFAKCGLPKNLFQVQAQILFQIGFDMIL